MHRSRSALCMSHERQSQGFGTTWCQVVVRFAGWTVKPVIGCVGTKFAPAGKPTALGPLFTSDALSSSGGKPPLIQTQQDSEEKSILNTASNRDMALLLPTFDGLSLSFPWHSQHGSSCTESHDPWSRPCCRPGLDLDLSHLLLPSSLWNTRTSLTRAARVCKYSTLASGVGN